ncbi:hypothetical protein NY08_2303 [Rhodococcus sp. B7740]|nr:hypothetical protein NY08_2303 [Rhodococcus sp. B7740]
MPNSHFDMDGAELRNPWLPSTPKNLVAGVSVTSRSAASQTA